MKLPIHVVNAFASGPFSGNPAAVVISDQPLSDELMQNIAAQNNLTETAFVVTGARPFTLRWLTPKVEVDLCGHATLASAHVLFSRGYADEEELRFESRSGELIVRRQGDELQLDFPSNSLAPVTQPDHEQLAQALGCPVDAIETCLTSVALMVVLKDEKTLAALKPDIGRVTRLHDFALAVTAPGDSVDFVARFFAPNAGIDEDPVTGSAYTFLAPYWARRLKLDDMSAGQLSTRGGKLSCRIAGERVLISGQALDYLTGEIEV